LIEALQLEWVSQFDTGPDRPDPSSG
jgi:hypothetical protein